MDITLQLLRKVLGSSLLLFAFITGTVGNSFVIYVFGQKKKRKSHYESLITLLAICDLLTSLTLPILNLYVLIADYKEWHFGSAGCKVLPIVSYASMITSQSILLMITYERFVKIKNPLKNVAVGYKVMVAWVIGSFVVAVASGVVRVIGLDVKEYDHGRIWCTYYDPRFGLGIAYSSIILRFIVLATIIYLTYMSARYLQQQQHVVQFTTMIRRAAKLRKSRRALVVVVFVFTLTTMPLGLLICVLTTMRVVGYVSYSNDELLAMEGLNLYFQWLRTLQSAANVLIYSKMFFKEFKTHIKALLCRHQH